MRKMNEVSDRELSEVYRKVAAADGGIADIILQIFKLSEPTDQSTDEQVEVYRKVKQNLNQRVSNMRKAAREHLAKQMGISYESTEKDDAPKIKEIDERVNKVFPQFRGRPERDMSELFDLLEELA